MAEQIDSALQRYLDKITTDLGLKIVSCDVTAGSQAGDNYVGIVQRVALTCERRDANGTEQLSLIYKCKPASESRLWGEFGTGMLFSNEAQFYNEVLTSFDRLQRGKRVIDGNAFSSVPKCYHAGEALILEDMATRGFRMGERRETLDVCHARLVLRELGKLHALSFALRDQNPGEFGRLKNMSKETLFTLLVKRNYLHVQYIDSAVKTFEETAEIADRDKCLAKLKKFQSEFHEQMMALINGENAEPFAVLTHGDCWTNNILFKYPKDSTVPDELCFLDFQIARYASPVTDIAYFLFCCTSRGMRQKYYDSLIAEYHDSLSDLLRDLGSDPAKMFPFAALQDQLRVFSKYGLGMAALTIPIFTCKTEAVPDLSDRAEDGSSDSPLFRTVGEACWTRMNGVIVDMVEMGYIC